MASIVPGTSVAGEQGSAGAPLEELSAGSAHQTPHAVEGAKPGPLLRIKAAMKKMLHMEGISTSSPRMGRPAAAAGDAAAAPSSPLAAMLPATPPATPVRQQADEPAPHLRPSAAASGHAHIPHAQGPAAQLAHEEDSYKEPVELLAGSPGGAVTIAGRPLRVGELPQPEEIHLEDYKPHHEAHAAAHSPPTPLAAHVAAAVPGASPLDTVQETALTPAEVYDAHARTGAAAAAAAALVHMGQPVRVAANVAEVAADPGEAFDFDSSYMAAAGASSQSELTRQLQRPTTLEERSQEPDIAETVQRLHQQHQLYSPEEAGQEEGASGAATAGEEAAAAAMVLPGLSLRQAGAVSVPQLQAAHDDAGRTAAVAGALVHLGQPVARAANLAEAATHPADAVDFGSARTNLPLADTVPDLVARHSLEGPTTPAAGAAAAQQAEVPVVWEAAAPVADPFANASTAAGAPDEGEARGAAAASAPPAIAGRHDGGSGALLVPEPLRTPLPGAADTSRAAVLPPGQALAAAESVAAPGCVPGHGHAAPVAVMPPPLPAGAGELPSLAGLVEAATADAHAAGSAAQQAELNPLPHLDALSELQPAAQEQHTHARGAPEPCPAPPQAPPPSQVPQPAAAAMLAAAAAATVGSGGCGVWHPPPPEAPAQGRGAVAGRSHPLALVLELEYAEAEGPGAVESDLAASGEVGDPDALWVVGDVEELAAEPGGRQHALLQPLQGAAWAQPAPPVAIEALAVEVAAGEELAAVTAGAAAARGEGVAQLQPQAASVAAMAGMLAGAAALGLTNAEDLMDEQPVGLVAALAQPPSPSTPERQQQQQHSVEVAASRSATSLASSAGAAAAATGRLPAALPKVRSPGSEQPSSRWSAASTASMSSVASVGDVSLPGGSGFGSGFGSTATSGFGSRGELLMQEGDEGPPSPSPTPQLLSRPGAQAATAPLTGALEHYGSEQLQLEGEGQGLPAIAGAQELLDFEQQQQLTANLAPCEPFDMPSANGLRPASSLEVLGGTSLTSEDAAAATLRTMMDLPAAASAAGWAAGLAAGVDLGGAEEGGPGSELDEVLEEAWAAEEELGMGAASGLPEGGPAAAAALGMSHADVAVAGIAPPGSRRLRAAHDHVAQVAAAAAGLMHAGQPLALAVDLAEVATAPAAVVDATSAHAHSRRELELLVAAGGAAVVGGAAAVAEVEGAVEALSGEGEEGAAEDEEEEEWHEAGSDAASSEKEEEEGARGGGQLLLRMPSLAGSVNRTDACVPLAALASQELLPQELADAASGSVPDPQHASAERVAVHNAAARGAAAAAALHYAGVPVAAAAELAEIAIQPAASMEGEGSGGGGAHAGRHAAAFTFNSPRAAAAAAAAPFGAAAAASEQLPAWYEERTFAPGARSEPAAAPLQPEPVAEAALVANEALVEGLLGAKVAAHSPRGAAAAVAHPPIGDAPSPAAVAAVMAAEAAELGSNASEQASTADWQEQMRDAQRLPSLGPSVGSYGAGGESCDYDSYASESEGEGLPLPVAVHVREDRAPRGAAPAAPPRRTVSADVRQAAPAVAAIKALLAQQGRAASGPLPAEPPLPPATPPAAGSGEPMAAAVQLPEALPIPLPHEGSLLAPPVDMLLAPAATRPTDEAAAAAAAAAAEAAVPAAAAAAALVPAASGPAVLISERSLARMLHESTAQAGLVQAEEMVSAAAAALEGTSVEAEEELAAVAGQLLASRAAAVKEEEEALLESGVVAMISAEDVLPEEEHMASGTMALSAAQPLPELEGFGQGEPEGGMQEGQEAEGVAALTAGVDELLPGSRMQAGYMREEQQASAVLGAVGSRPASPALPGAGEAAEHTRAAADDEGALAGLSGGGNVGVLPRASAAVSAGAEKAPAATARQILHQQGVDPPAVEQPAGLSAHPSPNTLGAPAATAEPHYYTPTTMHHGNGAQAGHDTLNAWPRGSYDQAGGGTKADQARVQGAALAQEEGVARGDAPAGVTDGEVV